ncbi:MAG: alpha/beta fold hydrolase, partial [Sphingomonadales bacterium]|nr:alpha/beta fold hydrolase [Sphingomonadales bacterium]
MSAHSEIAVSSTDQRFGLRRTVRLPGPLKLDSGAMLAPVDIAYETYGSLNADGSNAILICHALTGDQFVASEHPVTGKPGWWTRAVGPGKPIDPDRHFIICTNVLGSCLGSSGPGSIDPATGAPYAMRFPVITIGDMVRAQAMLLDHLGVARLAVARMAAHITYLSEAGLTEKFGRRLQGRDAKTFGFDADFQV